MTAIVVDASVSASWLFDDEDDPRAEAVFEALADATGLVPQLWHYEMRNILLVARRRNRITDEGLKDRIMALADLPLQTDADADLDRALLLAGTHTLSFYDALYLELAARREGFLASLDDRLIAAARAEGLTAQI